MTGVRHQPFVVIRSLAALGFVYVILRPVSSNNLLVPLLALLGLTAAATWLQSGQPLAAPWRLLWYLQLLLGAIGVAVASVNDNPGLVNGSLVYVAAPILFWIYAGSLSPGSLKAMLKGLVVATSVLATGILLYVLGQQGVLPEILPGALLQENGAGFSEVGGSTEIRLYGLSSLAAAGPVWCASLLVERDELLPDRRWRIYAAVSSVGAAIVGGRRAILVLIVLTPVLLWVCRLVISGKRPQREAVTRPRLLQVSVVLLGLVLVLGSLAIYPQLYPSAAFTKAARGTQGLLLSSSDSKLPVDGDVAVRREQAGRLLAAWSDAPLLGRGFGAVLQNYQRSDERPWNFELQYHLLLFQTGLVGLLVVAAMVLTVVQGLRAAASAFPALLSSLLVTATGGLAMLIANATNPYLQAPGHMWAVYLPLAVANVMLLPADGSRERSAPPSPPVVGVRSF